LDRIIDKHIFGENCNQNQKRAKAWHLKQESHIITAGTGLGVIDFLIIERFEKES